MKIRMLTTAACPDWSANTGQVIEINDKQARSLIEGGFAVEVVAAKKDDAEDGPDKDPEKTGNDEGDGKDKE